MKISAATLAVALILGGTSVVLPADSAQAQALESLRNRQNRRPATGQCRLDPPPGQPAFEISSEECVAIAGVLQPIQAQDWAAAQAALPAAQAAAQSPDARYQVAQSMLHIGINTNNTQLQAQAVDGMIASGRPQGEELSRLLRHQIEFATQAGNSAKAEQARARLLQLSPNDPSTIVQLANSQSQSDPAGAIRLYQQAIQAQQASGQPVPEAWRAQILRLAYSRRMPESVTYARELVAASPTPAYWHDALVIYRELNNVGEPLHLDYYRLMRATRSLTSERDYIEYADAAQSGAVFGEVKSVLDEALSRNVLNSSAAYARETLAAANRRIAEDRSSLASERRAAMAGSDGRAVLRLADAYYGYGQYADAIELYRAALQKGADASTVNTRLGAALAMSGQRAEAETAFRAVTGPRAEIANFWLLWLSTNRS